MCGGIELDAVQVSMLDSGGIAGLTGAPDFIVRGKRSCVLGESKVAAHSASHRYSFGQFTKYQTLGAILRCARAPELRREVVHLIISPEPHPANFCSDHPQWRPEVENGRLQVAAKHVQPRDSKNRFTDFSTWHEYIRTTLLSDRVNRRCELDPARVEGLLSTYSPDLVPTYVVTWGRAMTEVRALASAQGFSNLSHAASKLEGAAHGPRRAGSDRVGL